MSPHRQREGRDAAWIGSGPLIGHDHRRGVWGVLQDVVPGVGPTVDELARALLKPMLKEWLDANLAGIVEAQVQKEVERIARNAG